MNELRPVKTYSALSPLSLNDQTKFRLNEINKIMDYFNSEIQKREIISKKLSKILLVLITWIKYWLCYLQHLVE